ncbi:MAG TPA: flagellar hook-basal body complex protein FliE [Synergistales bacterium]|nr:flagellar hook-basal body complex protein FliE [Synergistales bacterium]HRV70989.1 flagellar hook-basal body complex protein FliE [Thermovirgaceae bacterium]
MRSSMINLSLIGNARMAYGSSVKPVENRFVNENKPVNGEKKVSGFDDALRTGLEKVNDVQIRAEEAMKAMVTGDVEDISEVAAAVSEADMALRLAVQIRDKLLDAYNQLVRISV